MKKLLCCLVALGALLLSGCGGGSEKIEVTNVVCPYTIQTQRDGILRMEVDTAVLPGYEWEYEASWGDICQVTIDEQENNAVLTLTGVKEGVDTITFRYMKGGDNPEYRFAVETQVAVDGEKKVELIYHKNQTFTGSGTDGADTEFPYAWTTDETGIVRLSITMEDSSDWSVIGESAAPFVTQGLLYEPEGCVLRVIPIEEGNGVVTLQHTQTGRQLAVNITVDSSLGVTFALEADAVPEAETETGADAQPQQQEEPTAKDEIASEPPAEPGTETAPEGTENG